MRKLVHPDLEKYRVRNGLYSSTWIDGNNGAFFIPGPCARELKVIASNGEGWDHVSVSTAKHVPNWTEMCFVKDFFWSEEEIVIQYHPAKSNYINNHPNCLHMWKPIGVDIPVPPVYLVGLPGKTEADVKQMSVEAMYDEVNTLKDVKS